jgi:hypothetical protein
MGMESKLQINDAVRALRLKVDVVANTNCHQLFIIRKFKEQSNNCLTD